MATVLAALQAPPDDAELTGWDHVLAAYRETAAISQAPRRVRRPFVSAAAAVALAALGSVAAAAYSGSLPASLQNIAHQTIAAPAVSGSQRAAGSSGSGHPAVSPVTGGPGYAMCKRYWYVERYGTASQQAVALRNVVRAAGGSGRVAAFCALAQHPGAASPPGRRVGQTQPPAGHHGKPTTPPGKGNGNGNGNASSNANSNGNGNAGGNGNGNGNGSGSGNGHKHGKKQ